MYIILQNYGIMFLWFDNIHGHKNIYFILGGIINVKTKEYSFNIIICFFLMSNNGYDVNREHCSS